MYVRHKRGWWLVGPDGNTIIAKFKDQNDAVEFACRKVRDKTGLVFIFGKTTGRIEKRIQT